MYCYTSIANRCILYNVCLRLLHKRAVHAGYRIGSRTCRRRRNSNDREHIHTHRARNEAYRRGNRRCQGNFLRRRFNNHYPRCRFLPHRFYGRNNRTSVPGVQFRDCRFGYNISILRAYVHANACNKTSYKARKTKLVLSQNRAFLRWSEQFIRKVPCRIPASQMVCVYNNGRGNLCQRIYVDKHIVRNGSLGRPLHDYYPHHRSGRCNL